MTFDENGAISYAELAPAAHRTPPERRPVEHAPDYCSGCGLRREHDTGGSAWAGTLCGLCFAKLNRLCGRCGTPLADDPSDRSDHSCAYCYDVLQKSWRE
jgi:hypothetical protein